GRRERMRRRREGPAGDDELVRVADAAVERDGDGEEAAGGRVVDGERVAAAGPVDGVPCHRSAGPRINDGAVAQELQEAVRADKDVATLEVLDSGVAGERQAAGDDDGDVVAVAADVGDACREAAAEEVRADESAFGQAAERAADRVDAVVFDDDVLIAGGGHE